MHHQDSRVKIPTLLHLTRLGYKYLSLKNAVWDESTNIFTTIFIDSISKINPTTDQSDCIHLLDEVSLLLDNEDLGKAFYERITEKSGIRLIDFEKRLIPAHYPDGLAPSGSHGQRPARSTPTP